MLRKKIAFLVNVMVLLLSTGTVSHAVTVGSNDAIGQVIKIHTRFHYFVGKPQWLLIVRDIDHNQNIPYLYEVKKGENFWIAYTYGRNYLISVSNLQFSPYRSNPYRSKTINNFCNLESNGHIIRGESLDITITGNLTPDTNTFNCDVLRYPDVNFTIVSPDASE